MGAISQSIGLAGRCRGSSRHKRGHRYGLYAVDVLGLYGAHLKEAWVAIPSKGAAQAAHELIEPIVTQIISSQLESHTIAETRFALLPQLVSGRLQIRNSKHIIEVEEIA